MLLLGGMALGTVSVRNRVWKEACRCKGGGQWDLALYKACGNTLDMIFGAIGMVLDILAFGGLKLRCEISRMDSG